MPDCTSCIFCCAARMRSISASFSMRMRSFADTSARSRSSLALLYAMIRRSSSFSAAASLFFVRICSAFANATSSSRRRFCSRRSACATTSSAFRDDICLAMASLSLSCMPSSRRRMRSRSAICRLSTSAPYCLSFDRFTSRVSYMASALSLSDSASSSSRLSSCRRRNSPSFFSSSCMSRIVIVFASATIWFICFTSSIPSARCSAALDSMAPRLMMSAFSRSVRGTFLFRSSSCLIIYSLRALALALRSASVSAARRIASRSSSHPLICEEARIRSTSVAARTAAVLPSALASIDLLTMETPCVARALAVCEPKRDSSTMDAPLLLYLAPPALMLLADPAVCKRAALMATPSVTAF
mmetsp:Transcript_44288/g.103875  ORF Transcript_44288/g.103875 Transcript_44288/m.103875 type:complete len:358 (+) Transcript_44288:975-2048(+)